ncbi:MAG TPA: hypothetical protein RMG45_27400, partial [Polyangiaceae bacterium LLY-WYZ-15_(1-7)]|nr:hypothetical protein [Polyangiaceae bacterium LLY-WYZ-15_(1-7)]
MAPPDVESPAPPTPPRRRRGARLLIVLIALWAGSAAADDLGGPLLVPVAGVRPAQLHSTFGAPRGGGRRRHQGVDIFAPRGR